MLSRFHVLKIPAFVVILVTIVTGFSIYELLRLPIVTSIEALVRKDDPNRIFYTSFRKTFGADDAVVVGIGAKNIFVPSILRYIQQLTKNFQSIDGVDDCLSITSTENIRGLKDDFIVEPLFEDGNIPTDRATLEHIKRMALNNPILVGNLINRSTNATLILIRTKNHEEDQEFESRLLKEINEVIKSTPRPHDIKKGPFVAGWPVVDVSMAIFMNKDVMTFVPISALLMGVAVYMFVGAWSFTFLIMIVMLLSLAWTMAALKLVGGAMSPLTSILPPLIMALSLSDGIHITTTYLHNKDIAQTIKETWWPCFLTSLTTAVGFLSLLVSDIPAIRHFGAASAAGMGIELFLSFTLLVTLLPQITSNSGIKLKACSNSSSKPSLKRHSRYPFHGLLRILAKNILRFRMPILLVTLIVVVVSAIGIAQIKVDTNMLDYFYESSDVRKATSFVDSHLGGANTIELSLRAKNSGDFLAPRNIEKVEQITKWLSTWPGITKVTSPNSFLKLMNRAFHGDNETYYKIPTSREMAAQFLLLYDGDELSHFLTNDNKWIRISARTNLHGTQILTKFYESLRGVLDKIFRESGIDYRLTGKTYIFNHMANDIVSSQIESLALASLIIFGIMFFVLKDIRLGIISIVPNLLPIIGNLAIMGYCGIPINTATAIISAVAIGIAVDDTIHFIVQYKREIDGGKPSGEAVGLAIMKKGRAAISTSLVLVVGFGILIISSFIPTAQFGVLSALIMLMALSADLVVLPALLSFVNR